MKKRSMVIFLLSFLLLLTATSSLAAQKAENPPTVQAILFYSPTCPHCHQVISEFLIPLQESYGGQLQILGVDTTDPAGQVLYSMAIDYFQIPENRRGVPALIVSNTVLVGAVEIPEQFPGLVEAGLLVGGIGWPDIPDLTRIVPDLPPPAGPSDLADASAQTAPTPQAESVVQAEAPEPSALPADVPQGNDNRQAENQEPVDAPPTGQAASSALSLQEAEKDTSSTGTAAGPPPDPTGFILAWIVLLGMIVALIYAIRRIFSARPLLSANKTPAPMSWPVPFLALLGLAVASYLAYVEVTQVEAVCGPIGECNIVQSSPHAQFLGIPIAVWGLLNYVAILVLWARQQYLSGNFASWSSLGLVLLTMFGTLFSIYLTLLELFAIKAICLWCLSSAVITTLIMILVTKDISEKSLQGNLAAQTNA